MISNKALEEFMEIWKEEFGTQISPNIAMSEATAILNMFNKVFNPVQKDWSQNYENKNEQKFTENQPLSVKL